MSFLAKKSKRKAILYVAIGNSLTVGIGAPPCHGFVSHYRRLAEQALHQHVELRKYAHSGATTGYILCRFVRHPLVKHVLAQATIITLNGGGNDLIKAYEQYSQTANEQILKEALDQAKANIGTMICEIRAIKLAENKPFILRVIDLYNPTPQLPVVERWIGSYNKYLHSFSSPQIAITNNYARFKGKEKHLIYKDGIHPNQGGYQLMAEELNRLGYTPLKS